MKGHTKLISLFLIILIVLLPVSFAAQIGYQYDANGNLVQDESNYYEYNGFDQLIKVRQGDSTGTIIAEYFYDDTGNRIQTIEYNGAQNTSTYYPNDNFFQVVNSTGTYNTTNYYAGNTLLASDEGNISYYHPDHLGSTTLVTNSVGGLLRETRYDPFGNLVSGGNDRYLYTGQEFDSETGLYYYGARFYKPEYYHFTQPDPLTDVYDPQSLNRFAYVQNNPYKYTDSSGEFIDTVLDIGFIGYDIYSIIKNPSEKSNYGALALDIVGAAIPGLTGLSLGVKTLDKAGFKALANVDKIADAVKITEKGVDASKTVRISEKIATVSVKELPKEAQETLKLIDKGGPFKYKNEGQIFKNREGLLPKHEKGYYKEYTVPTRGASDRGAQRIVTGRYGEKYYTNNHYKSFTKIK